MQPPGYIFVGLEWTNMPWQGQDLYSHILKNYILQILPHMKSNTLVHAYFTFGRCTHLHQVQVNLQHICQLRGKWGRKEERKILLSLKKMITHIHEAQFGKKKKTCHVPRRRWSAHRWTQRFCREVFQSNHPAHGSWRSLPAAALHQKNSEGQLSAFC